MTSYSQNKTRFSFIKLVVFILKLSHWMFSVFLHAFPLPVTVPLLPHLLYAPALKFESLFPHSFDVRLLFSLFTIFFFRQNQQKHTFGCSFLSGVIHKSYTNRNMSLKLFLLCSTTHVYDIPHCSLLEGQVIPSLSVGEITNAKSSS